MEFEGGGWRYVVGFGRCWCVMVGGGGFRWVTMWCVDCLEGIGEVQMCLRD